VLFIGLVGCTTVPATPTLHPTAGILGSANNNIPTPEPTNTATNEPPATFTPIPTITLTPTPGPSPTPSITPTPTKTTVPTRTPSPTPTSIPQQDHRLTNFETLVDPSLPFTPTPATRIPTAVPTLEMPRTTTNILLLGSDDAHGGDEAQTRTDTIIIASINTQEKTASMLSLPRDLYVYVPGWTMARINQAAPHGVRIGHPGGGEGLLEDTILYNFGIPIHYYARIDFAGFESVVDAMGGVEMAVTCELTDWRLISPELDPEDEDNWERFTLNAGIHQMDGDLALWYARSRLSTSDFDRNRRQQQLLRAILNTGVDLGLTADVPALYAAFRDTVDTDMDIGRMLQMATIANGVRDNGIQSLHFVGNDMAPWTIPGTGANVYIPNWNSAQNTVERLYQPPSLNQASKTPIFVQVVNRSGNPEMGQLVADNLAWYGLIPIVEEDDTTVTEETIVTYYGQNFKGSYDWLMSWVMDLRQADLELNDVDESEYDYQVVLGSDHDPCRPTRYNPRESFGN
jgi:LCP family protein required for cell wall assembly